MVVALGLTTDAVPPARFRLLPPETTTVVPFRLVTREATCFLGLTTDAVPPARLRVLPPDSMTVVAPYFRTPDVEVVVGAAILDVVAVVIGLIDIVDVPLELGGGVDDVGLVVVPPVAGATPPA